MAFLSAARPSWSQTSGRHLTTIDALRRFSGYFHLQNVVLRGEFVENGRRISLRGGDNEMQVMLADGVTTMDGPVEVRAQLYDIGRLTAADPRLGRYENKPEQENWPKPGEELVLNVTGVTKAEPDSSPLRKTMSAEAPGETESSRTTISPSLRRVL